jgi:transcriptional regulator with XRE-family HTH domain
MAGRDTTESQAIGSRIREARIKNGMSQAELAVKSSISLPHISDIELGKSNMMLPSFIRIAKPYRYPPTRCSARMYRV